MGKVVKTLDNRRMFINTLNELAEHDPNIIVIIPDVGFAYLDDPNNKFKVINLGVAEQSATLIASGLALSGFSVYLYTMINFVLFRPLEMVRNAIVCHNAKVTLIGVKGSSAYRFLGFSHNLLHEKEDINACKNIGLKSYVPKTTKQVRDIILSNYKTKKTIYIKL